MNKKNNLIKNVLILGIGRASTQLVAILLLPLYTLYLSPGDYGFVDLIITYIALFVPIITIKLETASFRYLIDARHDETKKKEIISNVLQIILPILLTCVIGFIIFTRFIHVPYSELILLNICIAIFSNILLQFARGLGENKRFAIACTLTGTTTLISAIIFVAILRMGAGGLLLAIALANLVCGVYLFFALKMSKYIGFKNRDKALQKSLIKYSYPLIPDSISWWIINISDRTIVSVAIGLAANGIYAVANKYAAIFNSIFSIFGMSWAESASVHIDSEDRDSFFSEIINASINLFGSLGLLLIVYIPLFFNFLISVKFSDSYQYIPILIIAAFLNAISGLYGAIFIAKKMTKHIAKTSIIAAIVNISINLVFISFIGIYAAAISTALAYLVMAIYRHHGVKKYVTITYKNSIFVKMAVLYASVMILYYFNNFIGNILSAIIITVIVILLNKSIIKVMKDKVLNLSGRRRKKLTVEQEQYEDSI